MVSRILKKKVANKGTILLKFRNSWKLSELVLFIGGCLHVALSDRNAAMFKMNSSIPTINLQNRLCHFQ